MVLVLNKRESILESMKKALVIDMYPLYWTNQ